MRRSNRYGRGTPAPRTPRNEFRNESYQDLAPTPDTDALWASPSNRRRRAPRGPWRGDYRPDYLDHYDHETRHRRRARHPDTPAEIREDYGPEPFIDYDWVYGARRPERYGWTGEIGHR